MSNWDDYTYSYREKENSSTRTRNIEDMLPEFAKMLSYFERYPDKFIDYVSADDSKFKLYPFQRIFLRVMARYKKVYITATRGTSKSFINILSMYLKCIFYPNIKLSLVAPQKDQASQIAQQNIEQIWTFVPFLKGEVKKTIFAKDYTRLVFKNDSVLDIVVASQGSRGLRRHGLSFEEIVQMEKHREIIGEVLLPLIANNRKGKDGNVSKHEIHKQIAYITTASSRQSYAWEQLNSVMMEMALGKSAFVLGNDWTLPAMFEQLDPNYIEEVRTDPSMSPLQFAREYISQWTGSSENSLVQLQDLEKCRVLTGSESEFVKKPKSKIQPEYIISVDVARSEKKGAATTAIVVFKITPRGNGTYIKHLINVMTYNKNMHFEDQSIFIKELVEKYKASMVVIDGNGLGSGLLDYLIKEDRYPSYSVVNDDSYDKYKQPNSLPLIFNIKSSTKDTNSSDIHNNFMAAISNHDLKILAPESVMREKLSKKELEKQAELLVPHAETSLFIEEVMNLSYKAQGNRTVVNRISTKMGKDRFSAVSYGLYYINYLEKENRKRKKQTFDATGFMAIKKPNYKVFG